MGSLEYFRFINDNIKIVVLSFAIPHSVRISNFIFLFLFLHSKGLFMYIY